MAAQAKFFEMPIPFEREQWREYGKHLMRHDRHLDKQRDNLPWEIGDWLVEGVRGGLKPKLLKREVLAITGKYSWNTLNNFLSVSKAIPAIDPNGEPSRRRETLDYSIHVLVAPFSPKDQDRLLDLAEEGDPNGVHSDGTYQRYTVRNFKNLISDMQERGELPKASKPPREPKSATINVKIPISDYESLKKLAAAKGFRRRGARHVGYIPDIGKLILWMAGEYFTEHKAELLDAVRKEAANPYSLAK